MTATLSTQRVRYALAAGLILALAACSDDDLILPGEREDIRPPDAQLAATAAPADAAEASRPISLPAQSNNADWRQSPGTPTYRTNHPALGAQPRLAWSVNIGAGDSRKQRITANPVVGGGRVFTLDAGTQVTAVTTGGAVAWTADVRPLRDSEGDATGGGLAYDNGVLYVSSGYGEVSALEAETGAIKWRQQLDATGSGNPLVAGNLLYLVAGDDTGWAINTSDGRIVWQLTATPSVANVLGGPAPVIANGLAVFAFGSGELIATFPQGGLRRWAASVAGQRTGRSTARVSDITGEPMVVGNTIFAGNHSGRLVAFDAGSGERLWTAGEGAMNIVWPAGDSIFATTDRNELIRVDARSGQIIWRVELPGFVKDTPRRRTVRFAHHGPVLAGGRLIVTSNDGLMRSFSPVDGSLLNTVEIPDGASTAPAIAGGVLYVVSTKGELHAFR